MKKIILFAVGFLVVNISAYTQSLSLTDTLGAAITGDTLTISGTISDTTLTAYVHITNNSASSINVKCKKIEIDTISGTDNTFCWGYCFPPWVDESPDPITIAPGATNDSDFHGDYQSNENVGTSIIAYTFFDSNSPKDTARVTVKYNVTSMGVDNYITKENFISSPFPNPAGSFTYFSYNIKSNSKSYIAIHNVLGSQLKKIELTGKSGKIRINTNRLTSGLYFYSFVVDDKVIKTKKLMISR